MEGEGEGKRGGPENEQEPGQGRILSSVTAPDVAIWRERRQGTRAVVVRNGQIQNSE